MKRMLMLRRSLLEISSRRNRPVLPQIPLHLNFRKEYSVASQSNGGSGSGPGKPSDYPDSLKRTKYWTIFFAGSSIAFGVATIIAHNTGYLDKLIIGSMKQEEQSKRSDIVNQDDLRNGVTVEQDAAVVQNVQEDSEIAAPTAVEKSVDIDPYYGKREDKEEENQSSEIKQLPIHDDSISDHNISTSSDKESIDSIATIQEDLGTKDQDVKPTTQHDEGGVQITSIPPTDVIPVVDENMKKSEPPQQLDSTPVVEENVMKSEPPQQLESTPVVEEDVMKPEPQQPDSTNIPESTVSNDIKEENSLLDEYLIKNEREQNTPPSPFLDKEVANDDDYLSKDGKLVLDFLEAIHTAEKRQADFDEHIFSEEKKLMKEKYEKELKDAKARELMYAERETILDKELHKEKLKAAAALKSLQDKLEEEFKMKIEQMESETELELKRIKDLAKAELIAEIASEKASQIERMEEANLNINALCMAFYARSEEARQNHSVHKLALGALALEDALSRGLPIQKEIDALNSYIDGIDKDSLLGLVMASLPEDTLKNGTDTILQLNHKLDSLKGTLRHFSLMPPGSGGILVHSLAYLASLLKVKETGNSGEGIESLMNQVESFLADGKVLEAAETLENGLKGSQAAEVVRDWVQQARNRAITEQALTLLQSYATSISHT